MLLEMTRVECLAKRWEKSLVIRMDDSLVTRWETSLVTRTGTWWAAL